MALREILEIESKRRETGQYCVIHLVAEGMFYRAYEWSAWLCFRYVSQFKATRRAQGDDGESVVFVGFPVSSLAKFTPSDSTLENKTEKGVDMVLPNSVFGDSLDPDALEEEYNSWKQSVPLSAKQQRPSLGKELKTPDEGAPHRISDIMFKVLSYPLEQKSPMECMAFLAELKQQLTNML